MEGTFEIKSQTSNATYEYSTDELIVQGSFVKDAQNDALISITGSCYRKTAQGGMGDYIGNFNGFMREDEVRYSISEMSRRDSNKVWDAIDEIEASVLGTDEAE